MSCRGARCSSLTLARRAGTLLHGAGLRFVTPTINGSTGRSSLFAGGFSWEWYRGGGSGARRDADVAVYSTTRSASRSSLLDGAGLRFIASGVDGRRGWGALLAGGFSGRRRCRAADDGRPANSSRSACGSSPLDSARIGAAAQTVDGGASRSPLRTRPLQSAALRKSNGSGQRQRQGEGHCCDLHVSLLADCLV